MPSPNEVVTALFNQLKGSPHLTGVTVEKNVAAPVEMNDGDKIIIVRDGTPGDPEFILGFRTVFYTHDLEIEVFVSAGDDIRRDDLFTSLCSALGAALENDLTLNSHVQSMDYGAPAPSTEPIDGSADIKSAIVTVSVDYQSQTPLG